MQLAPAARVLIVDDDASFRALLRTTLERGGFAVAGEAADGAEAVALAAELAPDLITMDLEMPVLDGAAATARLCEDGCAPIVIVSGSHSSELIGKALRAGARWHVAKHDVTDQLAIVVEAIVNGRPPGRAR